MKKLIVVLCTCLFALPLTAQDKFTVPELTDQQKYNTAVWQWHGVYIMIVYYAKSAGITVEEAGATVGDMAKRTWGKEVGFEDFVNSILRSLVVLTHSGKVVITGQSENQISILVTDFYRNMDNSLKMYGITRGELSSFYEAYISHIANTFGIKYEVTDTEEGMTISISKTE